MQPRIPDPGADRRPSSSAPGLWITPIRGRVALAALAWVLLYGAGLVVVVIVSLFAARAAGTGPPDIALVALVVLGGTAVAMLVAVWIHLLRRQGLHWSELGLRRPDHSPLHLLWQVPAVMMAGAAASALVLIPLGASDAADDDVLADLVAGGPAFVVGGMLTVAVLVPVAEEVVFRGVVLAALRARFRPVVGIMLAGTVFAAVHMLPPALPYLLVVGIALCAMAEWYRSIIPGIVLHGLNNALVFGGVAAAGMG